jgi:hypothetical protein
MANYMKDLAKMLGVEIDEEFEVEADGNIVKAIITDKDMHVLCSPPYWTRYNSITLLKGILCGYYTIKR